MLAIIPARGGSKGLPGKNIKELSGKPLIAYTIQEALKSMAVTRVIVSTDDKSIAEISVKYGAEVPFLRPGELATDSAKAIDTYLYTITTLEKEENCNIRDFIVLLPTSPLRESNDIDNACMIYKDNNADSVISYTKEHHPISWHKYITDNGKFEDVFTESNLLNRQDLRETYYPNGSIYVFSKKVIQSGKYYTDNSYAYLMPREKSIDIDTIEDFEIAEFYLKKRKNLNL